MKHTHGCKCLALKKYFFPRRGLCQTPVLAQSAAQGPIAFGQVSDVERSLACRSPCHLLSLRVRSSAHCFPPSCPLASPWVAGKLNS